MRLSRSDEPVPTLLSANRDARKGAHTPVRARRGAPARGHPSPIARWRSLREGSARPPLGSGANAIWNSRRLGRRGPSLRERMLSGTRFAHRLHSRAVWRRYSMRDGGRRARRSARVSHRGIVWNVPPASRVPSAGQGVWSPVEQRPRLSPATPNLRLARLGHLPYSPYVRTPRPSGGRGYSFAYRRWAR